MKAKEIQKILGRHLLRNNPNKRLFLNTFYKDFECDMLELSTSNYTTEYEIKISKADFKNDFKKNRKGKNKHEEIQNGERCNNFYFVAPKGVLKHEDIPLYAGLIEIIEYKNGYHKIDYYCETIKEPILINADKLDKEQIDKLYLSCYYKALKKAEIL